VEVQAGRGKTAIHLNKDVPGVSAASARSAASPDQIASTTSSDRPGREGDGHRDLDSESEDAVAALRLNPAIEEVKLVPIVIQGQVAKALCPEQAETRRRVDSCSLHGAVSCPERSGRLDVGQSAGEDPDPLIDGKGRSAPDDGLAPFVDLKKQE